MRDAGLLEDNLGLIRDCHVRSGRLTVAQVVHEAVGPLVDDAIRSTADGDLCRRLRALRDSLAGGPAGRDGAGLCPRRSCGTARQTPACWGASSRAAELRLAHFACGLGSKKQVAGVRPWAPHRA
jgi:hypothetical protein